VPHATASDGTRIYYELSGRAEGEPVLMLQGLGTDSRGWILQRRAVGRRHRVVVVDNRGVGRSDVPPGPYDLVVMAADAVAVLDHAGFRDTHVVGVSMGGILAQILAVAYPERVRSLVLTATSCRHHPWRRELLADWDEVARHQGMRALLGRSMRWLIGPRSRRRFGLTVGLLAQLILNARPEAFAAQVQAILGMDDSLREALGAVAVPTLVVAGTQDILTPVGDSEELAELIPGARLAVISGAAHGFVAEQAREYNRLLTEFLDEVTGTGDASQDVAATA
jgi:3-oxoadipate enol-lactonase